MNGIELRRTRLHDIAQIARLEKATFPTPWSFDALFSDIFLSGQTVYYTALDGGRVAGYGGAWLSCGEANITNIAIDPGYRRQGLGGRLLELLCTAAYKKGCDSISLEVRQSNSQARSLYEKHGFVRDGVRRGYYRDPVEDAMIMSRSLRRQP